MVMAAKLMDSNFVIKEKSASLCYSSNEYLVEVEVEVGVGVGVEVSRLL